MGPKVQLRHCTYLTTGRNKKIQEMIRGVHAKVKSIKISQQGDHEGRNGLMEKASEDLLNKNRSAMQRRQTLLVKAGKK